MLKVQKNGRDSWAVQGTVKGVRVRRVVRGDKDHAEEIALIEARRAAKKAAVGVTFDEVVDQYLLHKRLHRSTVATAKRMAAEYGEIDVGKLDLESLKTWRGNVSPGTVRKYIKAMRTIVVWGEKAGLYEMHKKMVTAMPDEDDPRDRFLESVEEVDALCECADEWFRPFVVLLFQTGVRMGAMCNLTWGQVKDDYLSIQTRKGSGKIKTYRAPLNTKASAAIDELRARAGSNPKPNELVFKTRLGARLWSQKVYKPWATMCERAGVDDFHVHDARRTFATLLIRKGVATKIIAELLGHEGERMLSRYAYLAPSQLVDAVRVLE